LAHGRPAARDKPQRAHYRTNEPFHAVAGQRRRLASAAFTVRLEESTLGALDRLAEKTERSRNWLVARAIERYVALNAWQIGKIEAGIAAADARDFAGQEDVARVRDKFANAR
jgi:predicted transcriptional regulator